MTIAHDSLDLHLTLTLNLTPFQTSHFCDFDSSRVTFEASLPVGCVFVVGTLSPPNHFPQSLLGSNQRTGMFSWSYAAWLKLYERPANQSIHLAREWFGPRPQIGFGLY